MGAYLVGSSGFWAGFQPTIGTTDTNQGEFCNAGFAKAGIYGGTVAGITIRQKFGIHSFRLPERTAVYKTVIDFFYRTVFKLQRKPPVSLRSFCVNHTARSILVDSVNRTKPVKFLFRSRIPSGTNQIRFPTT